MNVLVIGRGSIGRQHAATLASLKTTLGLTVHIFEPSSHSPAYYRELARVLEHLRIQAAFVCNPTSMHAKTTLACLDAGVHVFVEKPIASAYDKKTFVHMARLAKEKKLTLMVGYDMRFSPWIVKAKELVESGAIGKVVGARIIAGQYLPHWRPGQEYRTSYSAKKALGGGVLLDLSHELDYLLWLMPKKVAGVIGERVHTGHLPIETEDIASITVRFADKSLAHVYVDYLTVPYRRSLELYGEEGTLLWDMNAGTLRIHKSATGTWQNYSVPKAKATGKAMFKNELAHFFDCIKHKKEPINSLKNAVAVMELISKV